ncbi:hypothetical protein TNCV_1417151 [Trichonephila clavipes]|nr:hypothetical protein TNCV_1417151 [Trichonephila clavipes]
MPLIEDLSRYGIEDCSYSPEAQKSNAYSTPILEKREALPDLQEKNAGTPPDYRVPSMSPPSSLSLSLKLSSFFFSLIFFFVKPNSLIVLVNLNP